MAKKVKNSDLIVDDFLVKSTEQGKAFLVVLDEIESKLKKNLTASSKIASKDKDFEKATKNRMNAVLGLERVKQQKLKTDKAVVSLMQQEQRLTIQEKKEKERLIKIEKKSIALKEKEAKANRVLTGTEEKLIATNKKLTLERRRLNTETKKGRLRLKEINSELDRNNAKIKKNSDALTKQRLNVGNYASALKGAGSALRSLGLGLGAGLIARNVVGIFSGFQDEAANLASVLGKTRKEAKLLTDDAKRLGASTKFTAKEVIKLQTAFAKLGFKEKEILDATEATLSLAAATGSELNRAAEVAASTIRGFGLDASDTQNVVDVMAKSFSTSSLDMEKFATAMAAVAPASKAAGISLNRTTALIGTITDAGIDASTAGTALRNIFLDLSKSGLSFDEAMKKIRTSSNKNATAMDLFGKRGAVVAQVLADGGEKAAELEKGLNNAGGAAKKMADEQLNTLTGRVALLNSAWEGFILSLEDGDGVISRVLRGAIDEAAHFLQILTQIGQTQSQIDEGNARRLASGRTQKEIQQQKEINELFELSNEELEKRSKLEGVTNLAAKTLLRLRNQGLSDLNSKLLISQNLADGFNKNLNTALEIQKEYNGATDAQRFHLQDAQKTTFQIADNTAGALVHQQDVNKLLKGATQDQLNQLILSKATGTQQRELVVLAEKELQRRKDIKTTVEETGVATSSNHSKELTGLDLLKKKLSDKIKLLNDEFVINKNSEKFRRLSIESEQDEEHIKFLEERIRLSKELEKFDTKKVDTDIDEIASGQRSKARREDENEELESFQKVSVAIEDENDKIEDALQARQDLFKNAIQAISESVQEGLGKRVEAIDKEIAASQNQQNILRQISKEGVADAKENLAFEQKKQVELEKAKADAIKKAANIEAGLALIGTYQSNIEAGQNPGQALTSTALSAVALKQLISTLDFFDKGTEDTGTVANPLDSKGGRLTVTHDNERIMSAAQNKPLEGISNWELSNLGAMYKTGTKNVDNAIKVQQFQSNEQVMEKFGARIETAIKNIPITETNVEWDKIEEGIVEKIMKKNAFIRNHYS